MNNAKTNRHYDRTLPIYFIIDLLTVISIGFLISILIVMLTIFIAGPKFSVAEITKVAIQIFSPKSWEYDSLSGLAFLIPIVASAISISVTRNLIEQSTNRKSWVIVIIFLVISASLIGILSSKRNIGLAGILVLPPYLIYTISPTGVFLFFATLLIALSFSIIFVPQRHIIKMIVASIVSAIIGGSFELLVLGLALYEAF